MIAAGAVVATWLARRFIRVRRRSRRAESVARDLVPEIRAIIQRADPKGDSDGDPGMTPVYTAHRQEVSALFSQEVLFAAETFYQGFEAYRDARRAMIEAFSEASEASLGDRIRAKDLRDRCSQDLFYSGAALLEHLEKLSRAPAARAP